MCSTRFNFHIVDALCKFKHSYPIKFQNKLRAQRQFFDARLLGFPEDKPIEHVNHMIWRSLRDCPRNAVSAYAHFHIGHKSCQNKNTDEMIEMLKE